MANGKRRDRLSGWDIFLSSLLYIKRNSFSFFKLLALCLILIGICAIPLFLASAYVKAILELAFPIVLPCVLGLCAISWHRKIIFDLENESYPNPLRLHKSELVYILLCVLYAFIIQAVPLFVEHFFEGGMTIGLIAMIATLIVSIYPLRWALILPAMAVGKGWTLKEASHETKPYRTPIIVAMLWGALLIWGSSFVVAMAFMVLNISGYLFAVIMLLSLVLMFLIWTMINAGILSICFKHYLSQNMSQSYDE